MNKAILVTGGAGYVGSAVSEALIKAGHKVVIADNFTSGFTELVAPESSFYPVSYGDYEAIKNIIEAEGISSIVHCAAKSLVKDSVENPIEYYKSNVADSIELLRASVDSGIKEFIFSSSAAVYGQPNTSPIKEEFPLLPINPYGETKVAFEGLLAAASVSNDLKAIAFRYFNVAGATSVSKELHQNETHLIPRMISSADSGLEFFVFGDDYDTPDGSAVRDYVHVADIADAHVMALNYFDSSQSDGFIAINIGSGTGTSVFDAAQEIGNQIARDPELINIVIKNRREGDPASLVADVSLAKRVLGWEPVNSTIEKIINSIT
jgi:UDP-glucose 4-epimerase